MKIPLSIVLFFLFFELLAQEKKEMVVETNVSEATVFINGAQVTRKKTVEVTAGKSVLKFVGCSPFMDSKSVQVKAHGGCWPIPRDDFRAVKEREASWVRYFLG